MGGQQTCIGIEHAKRIEDALFESAQVRPEKVALVDHSWSLDYASLGEWVQQFAIALLRRGVCRGDRVSLLFDKTPDAVVALYGIWHAGGVAVPINGGLKSRQIEHIIRHSGSKYLVTSKRKLSNVGNIVTEITTLQVDPLGLGAVACAGVKTEDHNELAAILYTSGSTGMPKGVALSHNNLRSGARIVTSYLGIQEDDQILSVLPFSFDYGLNQLLTAVGTGATVVMQRSLLPADICRALTKHEITGLAGVPPLWMQLVHGSSPFTQMFFPKLRYITNSGGVLPVNIVSVLRRVIPHTKFYLMYGLTEAFRSTYLPPEEIDRRPTSIGRPIPECEVYVVSAEGKPCRPGEIGELVHRGPTVALGYWQDPEATAEKFRPNPFSDNGELVVYSGDFVTRDDEGFLYFIGRCDEMIKSLGYRISPTEIEATIYESGMVAEVVVRSAPDPVCGEAVVVHCVPSRANDFSIDQLLAYCRREMPAYMVPKSFVVHSSLPRTTSGKIDRKAVANDR